MTGQFEFYYAQLLESLGWTRIQVTGDKSDLTWASIWPCTVVQCAGLRVRVSAEAGLRTSLGLSVAWCGYLVHARGRGSRPVSACRRCAPAVPPGRGAGVAARR